jgi:transposase
MRSRGSAEELEHRRIRAVELLEEGVSRLLLARILGVRPSSLSRWRKLAASGTLGAKPHLGPSRKLSDDDFLELERLLTEGATAYGWINNLWTATRVGRLIYDNFGVKYHPAHISRILRHRLNWTCQRPVNHHEDRDDKAIERWVRRRFPGIMRDAVARNAFLVFIDESGFMLEPNVRRTYAPCGKTPTNRISAPHARISAAGAIIVDFQAKRVGLAYHLLADNANFQGWSIVEFLSTLRAMSKRPLTVLWDQIPIHSGEPVDQYLADHPDDVIESFPPYAPELNAADGIWRYIKHARLANYSPRDLGTLRKTLTMELNRLRRRDDLLKSFIRFTKLPLDT